MSGLLRWRCKACHGENVQASYPVWVPMNEPACSDRSSWDPDWEASPLEWNGTRWCPDCEEHTEFEELQQPTYTDLMLGRATWE